MGDQLPSPRFCDPLKRENYRFLEYATPEKEANVEREQSGERRIPMSAKAIDEMSTRTTWVKVLLVTILVAIPAFILGPLIWPPAEGNPSPTATQIPFLLFLNLVQATVLGLGVSFLASGLYVMRRISPDSKVRA
jgi:hypothetical protein